MQKYGLKITSEFDLTDKKQIFADGDIEIKEEGVYEVICNANVKITHVIHSGLSHIYAISNKDGITIAIDSHLEVKNNLDIYHEIVTKNNNVHSVINANAAVFDNTKLIYRSNLGADFNTTGEGVQKAKILYFGDNSEVDVIPNLDIKSALFKTSHSVSVSSFDKIQKFYLSLHGFEDKQSEDFIVESFLGKK